MEEDSLTIIKPQLKLKFNFQIRFKVQHQIKTKFRLRSTKISLKTKMTSPHRRLRRKRQRQQVLALIIALYQKAQEEIRRQQLQDQEDMIVLTTLHFNDLESNHTTWARFARNCKGPPPSPKPAPSPNLNADEAEFFKKSFYLHSKLRELQQDEDKQNGDPFLSHKEKDLVLRTVGY